MPATRAPAPATNSWLNVGITPRAVAPSDVGVDRVRRASRGRRGPPRRRAPRCGGGSWRPARRRRAGTPCRRRTQPCGGSSKSTTSRRNASGTCIRMPGAVTGVDLGAGGTAVVEVAQRGEGLGDDVVAGLAGQRGDERDAAGVVLVARVVEPLGRRERVQSGILLVVSRRLAGRPSEGVAAPACRHATQCVQGTALARRGDSRYHRVRVRSTAAARATRTSVAGWRRKSARRRSWRSSGADSSASSVLGRRCAARRRRSSSRPGCRRPTTTKYAARARTARSRSTR